MSAAIFFVASLPLASLAGLIAAMSTWRTAEREHREWRRFQRARAGMLTREVEH